MRARLIFPGFLFLTLVLAIPSLAAKDASKDKLQKVQTEMLWQKKQAEDLDRKSRETAGNLQELQKKLIEATRALQDKQDEEQQVEERLKGLENEITAKNTALDKSRHELSTLTAVLIRIAQQPPETYFLRAGLTDEHIHRAILARALLPRLEAESESNARDLAVLADLRWMAKEQKRLVEAAQKNLKSQQSGLDQLVQTRQGLLNRTEKQKTAIAEQLVSLTNEARGPAAIARPGGASGRSSEGRRQVQFPARTAGGGLDHPHFRQQR